MALLGYVGGVRRVVGGGAEVRDHALSLLAGTVDGTVGGTMGSKYRLAPSSMNEKRSSCCSGTSSGECTTRGAQKTKKGAGDGAIAVITLSAKCWSS